MEEDHHDKGGVAAVSVRVMVSLVVLEEIHVAQVWCGYGSVVAGDSDSAGSADTPVLPRVHVVFAFVLCWFAPILSALRHPLGPHQRGVVVLESARSCLVSEREWGEI